MKVSVIIPAHNEEQYISTTLMAVLALDYPDFEVIVVDNASSDRTAEVAAAFPVKVVSEHNKGTQWARERGRLTAQGEILAYLDADCQPEKDWLTRGVPAFAHPDVSAVTGPYDYFDASWFVRYSSLWFQRILYSVAEVLMQFLHIGAIIIGGNFLIRASSLEKIGGHTTMIHFYGDDTDTAKRIAKVGRVVWDNRLLMKTSSRRFKSEGFLKTFTLYVFYFFKVIFSSKHK